MRGRQAFRLLVYWALFAFFAVGALSQGSRPRHPAAKPQFSPMLTLGAAAMTVIVGLRYEVGADWQNYERIFSQAMLSGLGSALTKGDPGYQFVNWMVSYAGAGIWLVNLICAAIFVWGLLRFARAQPDPWLAVVIAMPYFVVVVAMGYTRQAVALGILMGGLAALQGGASVVRFAAYVAIAALFHRTAVVVLPLVIFASERNRLLNFIAGAASAVLFYDIFLSSSVSSLMKNYIDARYASQGAAIRVSMNLVPAVIMLVSGRKLGFLRQAHNIWKAFSVSAVVFLIALVFAPSSTAVDRMALYILPLQIAVLTRVPSLFKIQGFGIFLIVAYALTIQFTWLNFATHAQYWFPYRFYPVRI